MTKYVNEEFNDDEDDDIALQGQKDFVETTPCPPSPLPPI